MHVERDGVRFYVDLCGFGFSDRATRKYEMICKDDLNFQYGFAYFVGPARAPMGPCGPIWTCIGPYGPV